MYQDQKDQQWKQAMDYLSAVTELNYMTQIVIMLYEDNNKVSCLQRAAVLNRSYVQISSCVYVFVVNRTRLQRSVSMSSFTSVQESKDVKTRRTYLSASASVQPPLRCVNMCTNIFRQRKS